MLSSSLASLTLYVSVKILELESPKFTEKWLVPLLFLLSPMFVVISGLILTEVLGILLAVSAIYVFISKRGKFNNWNIIQLGLIGGGAYHLREPLVVISIYILLHLLYNKKLLKCSIFILAFIPFLDVVLLRLVIGSTTSFVFPSEITNWAILPTIIIKIIGGRIGDVERMGSYAWNKAPALFHNFIKTSLLNFGVMLIFSLGVFTSILIIYGLSKKKIHHISLLSLTLMMVSSMYLSRFDVYRLLFYTKISTVMRYGVMSIFSIPLIPQLIGTWNKKQIKYYALISIVSMSLVAIPFTKTVQSNLSSEYISRLDILNYQSPWLIARELLELETLNIENKTNVLVISEPLVRVRFYNIKGIKYIPSRHLFWLCIELGKEQAVLNNPDFIYDGFTEDESTRIFKELILSQYEAVYLYGEKYSLYETVLEKHAKWYWEFLQNESEYTVLYENEEMYLYKVILN